MNGTPLYHRVMSGEAGAWAAPLRVGLGAAAHVYAALVAYRNRRYDEHPRRVQCLSVPVISVGNVTVGGTGKTPMVIGLAERLQRLGRRPAVVSRGYGPGNGADADELRLVRQRIGDAITVADPDRITGGRRAIERGADVVVLDDAFQHRRIHRDLDIVLIDVTAAFGYGRVLPRGLLREPLEGLHRADLLVLTRTDQAAKEESLRVEGEVRRYNADAPVVRSVHLPTGLTTLSGECVTREVIRGRRVMCFSGIGNAAAFVRTVEQAGATVLHSMRLRDHAAHGASEHRALTARLDEFPEVDYVVTTEKDAVKLDPAAWSTLAKPILTLPIRIDFGGEGDRIVDEAITQIL